MQQFSAFDGKESTTPREEGGLEQKCHILQAKLNQLTDALSEVMMMIMIAKTILVNNFIDVVMHVS